MYVGHNFKALPQRRRAYIVTEDQFNEYFGEFTTNAFDIFPHPQGRSFYLISTGETFTVVPDPTTVKQLVTEHVQRAEELKAKRETKKEAK